MPELKDLLVQEGLVLGPQIGSGSFGVVYRCTDVKTHMTYAVKVVDLRKLRMQPHFMMDRLERECAVLEKLEHSCIVKLFRTIHSQDCILMIMEMVLGMELFEMIVALSGITEKEGCAIFVQIASALAYMHKKGIVHRDVKPENILIQGHTELGSDKDGSASALAEFENLSPRIKLIDFGLSKIVNVDGGSIAKSLVGTPRYVAPEILALSEKLKREDRSLLGNQSNLSVNLASYGDKVDCYSTGVLLHVMLSACFPQFDDKQHVIFVDPRVSKVSNNAKDLIRKLMHPNPNERMAMRETLEHSWVKTLHPKAAFIGARLADGLTPIEISQNENKQSKSSTDIFVENNTKNSTGADDADGMMSYEEFEARILKGNLIPKIINDEKIEQREDSLESILVDSEFVQTHNLTPVRDNNNEERGVKRQVSSSAATSPEETPPVTPSSTSSAPLFSSSSPPIYQEENNSNSHSKERRPRNQSMNSTKSSYEVLNLPGAAKGVWGPFNEIGRGDSETSDDAMFGGFDATQREIQQQVEDEHTEMVPLVTSSNGTGNDSGGNSPNVIPSKGIVDAGLLLQLQTKIAQCFNKAFEVFRDDDVVSPGIISSAVGSRELLRASVTILKKLEQTSLSVLDLLPDMQIAVEEGEFGMAVVCFDKIKDWIRILQKESQDLLKANVKVIAAVNNTLQLARRRNRVSAATAAGHRMVDALAFEDDIRMIDATNVGSGTSAGAIEAAEQGHRESSNALKQQEQAKVLQERLRQAVAQVEQQRQDNEDSSDDMAIIPIQKEKEDEDVGPISKALQMLKQIDGLLQKHASFWSQMEVVVDVMMQRANHVESMVSYTRNPRLRGRFLGRVQDYAGTWEKVRQMCQRFHRDSQSLESTKLYQFLTDG